MNGHYDIVKLLIQSGADIFERDSDNLLPLDIAIEKRHNEIYDLLMVELSYL